MKLSVLTENMASGHFLAEFGLSYFIEHDGKNILFDTGHSDVFLKNAERLNIDIGKVDIVVLSHGHWDHGNGLKYLSGQKLLCHPGAFIKRYHRNDHVNLGLELNYEKLNTKFELIRSKEPYHISQNIVFLGEVPRVNHFEAQTTAFIDENKNNDFVRDDSALVIIIKDELVVVSGCAHSGICNIVEYSREVTGFRKVHAVIGGFHLKTNDIQTQETIRYFKELKVKHVFPSHCTQLPALAAFYHEFKMNQVATGMVLYF